MSKHIAIIGAGPGGYVAAIRAARLGAQVTLIEKGELGGVCLNEGCIPTKILNKNAEVIGTVQRAAEFGVTIPEYSVDFSRIMERKAQVVSRLKSGVAGILKRGAVKMLKGHAYIEAADTIRVTMEDGKEEIVKCDDLIIATGSRAFMPPIKGIEHAVTNREVLSLTKLPKSMVIIGGGVIGIELACIFARFGTKITVVEMMDRILPTLDADITAELMREMKKDGIKVYTSCGVEEIAPAEGGFTVTAGEHTFTAELVLGAIGRRAVMPEGTLALECDRGGIITDEYLRTNIPHVYCIGDANGKHQLAHVASAEALVAVDNIMGGNRKMSYRVVPSVIYSFPEVACVGVGEADAKNAKKGTFPYAACGKAMAMGETAGYAKVLAEPRYDEIVGAQIIGHDAATLIGEMAMAMQLEATTAEVSQLIHAHPSLSEILMECCEDAEGMAIHK